MLRSLSFIFVVACGSQGVELPTSYSIDPRFNSEQSDSIRLAASEWCGAVDFCIPEVTWPNGSQIAYEGDLSKYGFDEESAVHIDRDLGPWILNDILCDMSLVRMHDPDLFHAVILHEWGHHGNTSHADYGLMGWVLDQGVHYEVDEASIENWCERVGC